MKGYLEYLELYTYFARNGEAKLSQVDFAAADVEYKALVARLAQLDRPERLRLEELKAVLFRDRP